MTKYPFKFFRHAPISMKVVMVSLISSGMTLLLLIGFFAYRDHTAFFSRSEELLGSVASLVAANSEAALAFDDPMAATENLSSLLNQPEIVAGFLYDENGQFFAMMEREGKGILPPTYWEPGFSIEKDFLVYAAQVNSPQGIIGHLILYADKSQADAYKTQTLIVSSLAFAIAIIIAGIVAIFSQRLISTPITRLRDLAEKVSQENNYSLRAEKDYKDEIGSLVDSFNFMLNKVEVSDRKLKASHDGLTKLVEARTKDLRLALENAEAASRAKSQFLATMSHELRTPLNAIIGISSFLMHNSKDSGLIEQVNIIQKSAENLLTLIRDILDFSKIEAGRLELEMENCSLIQLIDHPMQMVDSQKRLRPSVQFFSTVDPNLPASIITDQTRLRQILVNLIGNAVKFTERGHVWLEAGLTLDSDKSPFLTFAVHDTGLGISEKKQQELFQAFRQVDSSSVRRFEGTGLGLVISRKLANAFGGEILLESQEGVGSTFTLKIPLRTEDTDSGIAGKAPWPEGRPLPVFKMGRLDAPLSNTLKNWFSFWKTEIREDLDVPSNVIHLCDPSSGGNISIIHLPQPWSWSALKTSIDNTISPKTSESPNPKKPSSRMSFRNLSLRVLLVDDNKVNQKVFELLIRQLGIRPATASGGHEAVDRIEKEIFDLAFIDYQMPDMDGIEVTRIVRKMGHKIRQPYLVGFSANVQAESIQNMLNAGLNDFLPKPAKIEDIERVLANYAKLTGLNVEMR